MKSNAVGLVVFRRLIVYFSEQDKMSFLRYATVICILWEKVSARHKL